MRLLGRRFAPGIRRLALAPLVAGLLGAVVAPLLGLVGLLGGLAVLWFHRDPERSPAGEGVVAPADGRVSVVREDEGRLRVGVFMNVWDVHVNRAPLAGAVREVTHRPGANRPAFSKESERNEQVRIDCERDGERFAVVLIAGWFARRIHPHVEAGDDLARGDRVGHISFGSRADVLFPSEYDAADLQVEEGDRVRAGETVVAPE